MDKGAHFACGKCGEKQSMDGIVLDGHETEGVVVVHYDPNSTNKVVLVNSKSGSRREVDLSSEQYSTIQGRHLGGIIGPY